MNPVEMTTVIGGKRYSTKTATLIAHNVYWDGHNFERHGRNTWLYMTPGGAFFTLTRSQWQGERDTITPVSSVEALELYEGFLPEQVVEWEEIWGEPEEPVGPGRPPMFGEKMVQTAIWLPSEMIVWLKAQPGSMSETIRHLIEQAQTNDDPHDPPR